MEHDAPEQEDSEQAPPVRFLLPGMKDWAPPPGEQEPEPAEELDERLSAFLLTSLQMQHLSVLAGSGTSFSVGGPTMDDLWSQCVADNKSTAVVLSRLRYGLLDGERNIEELLSRCDAHLQVNSSDTRILRFRNRAIGTILRLCRDVGNPEGHDMGPHKEFLRRLARRRARDPRLKVFTTNYDLCFERAAGALGLVALDDHPFAERFATFFADANARVMRLCLGGVSYEYRAREFIVNAIGRAVLNEARKGTFRQKPLLVILDEAHNFLGSSIGSPPR